MIRSFICSNGMVFAASDEEFVLVDDVIAFLEQFRGMSFWNGATGDVAFRFANKTVCCDSKEQQIAEAHEVGEAVGEMVEAFFNSNEAVGFEEEWRERGE